MDESPQRQADPVSGRDPALDGVRGLACLLIYFFHMGVDLRNPPFVVQGFTGVTVFFVLSGFLMFGPFVAAVVGDRPFPTWRSYAIRRFTRIYPPYAVSLVVYTVARFATDALRPGLSKSPPPDLKNLLLHALLIFNYADRQLFFSICAVFWSLAVEAQFYLLLPIGFMLAIRLAGRTRQTLLAFAAVVAAIGLVSRALECHYFMEYSGLAKLPRFVAVTSYLDLFAAGMVVAVTSQTIDGRRRLSTSVRWAAFGIGLAGFLAAENWSVSLTREGWQLTSSLAYTTFYPAASAGSLALMLLALVTRPSVAAAPLTWKPLVRLGKISFSLYLYHILVQVGVSVVIRPDLRYPGPWEGIITAMIALVPTLIVAVLAYYLVERPALAWGQRYSSHKRLG